MNESHAQAEAATLDHEEAGVRSSIYRFIARSFLEKPTAEFYASLNDTQFLTELGSVFPTEDLETAARKGLSIEEVQEEFDALFRVPGKKYVTPFESVYQGQPRKDKKKRPGGCLMGQETLDVMAWHQCTGFTVSEALKELPDHVGCEFAFLGGLCAEEASALSVEDPALAGKWRRAQARFLEEHLLTWFPALCKKVQESDEGGMYAGITSIATTFLESEKVRLGLS